MKTKGIISLVVSVIISANLLVSCAVTPESPATQGMDVTARATETPEDGRGLGLQTIPPDFFSDTENQIF